MEGFGAKYQLNSQVAVAMVNLLTKIGDTVLLSVLVLPRNAIPLQNTSISVNNLTYLHDHSLTTEKESEISLLTTVGTYLEIMLSVGWNQQQ